MTRDSTTLSRLGSPKLHGRLSEFGARPARNGSRGLLLSPRRRWIEATALVGLVFLGGGYAAPIAAAAREYGGPEPLPTLELPQLAFPVFDPDGKADSVADKHDAADAEPAERTTAATAVARPVGRRP